MKSGLGTNAHSKRRRLAACLLLVPSLAAALVGCGDDDTDAGAPLQLSLPSPVQGIIVVNDERPMAWARDAAGGDAVGYALCPSEGCTEIELVGLGGDAGDVVAVGGDLWVAPRVAGEQVRVVAGDGSGSVTTVGPELSSPAKLAVSGQYVYATDVFDLYRFDAANPGAVPEVVSWASEATTAGAVVATDDAVWIFGTSGDVVRVDAESLNVTTSNAVGLGVDVSGAVAVGPDGLYVTTTIGGADSLVALDPDSLDVIATYDLDADDDINSTAVAVIGDRVVVATDNALIEFDPATLAKGDATELPFGLPVGIVVIGETVWVATVGGVTIVGR